MSSGVRGMLPREMRAVFGKLVYDTGKSVVIASDAFHDGKNWERRGTNTYLYRTKHGRYFKQFLTRNENQEPFLEPLSLEDAITLYYKLGQKEKPFEDAFPNVSLEDA